MGGLKLLTGFALGAIFFAACSTADIKFPYKFFHVSPIQVWNYPSAELRGDKVRAELRECAPKKNQEGKLVQQCVVVFYSELNKFVADYKNTKQALIDCQRGR